MQGLRQRVVAVTSPLSSSSRSRHPHSLLVPVIHALLNAISSSSQSLSPLGSLSQSGGVKISNQFI
ncbi:hypothetical protein E2C01_101361 [Portunus trituberculatus]|uniref:Uncharacterized protein n=1 Tax=Portunus trituberculatus TaxID=210409 RepID=A0A5B7KK96_PORTR|nr:hypothetical protein [Portunus trituberculatus]